MQLEVMYHTVGKVRVREETPDKFLLYHDEKGYETNAVGAEIIKRCAAGTSSKDLCTHLATAFEAPSEVIADDCMAILEQFVECGLLTVVGGGS